MLRFPYAKFNATPTSVKYSKTMDLPKEPLSTNLELSSVFNKDKNILKKSLQKPLFKVSNSKRGIFLRLAQSIFKNEVMKIPKEEVIEKIMLFGENSDYIRLVT